MVEQNRKRGKKRGRSGAAKSDPALYRRLARKARQRAALFWQDRVCRMERKIERLQSFHCRCEELGLLFIEIERLVLDAKEEGADWRISSGEAILSIARYATTGKYHPPHASTLPASAQTEPHSPASKDAEET